jgi:XTP/dITP diphosphohydrolase
MKRLLIATTNPAKLAEYRILLRDFALMPISLRDAGITDEAPEDGATFSDNARQKAAFYFARAGIPTLADDGGLEVDALGGAPGVNSHRWLGDRAITDRMLAEEVVRRMEGAEQGRRGARMRAAVAIVWREGGELCEALAEAALEGEIALSCYPEIRAGFPYRSVLYLPARGRYLAELSEEEAARLSQRRDAIERLGPTLWRLAAIP